jgi:hypothetical protein
MTFQRLSDALHRTGLSLETSAEEASCSARTLLLFLSHLYVNLPNLLPKVCLTFILLSFVGLSRLYSSWLSSILLFFVGNITITMD